MDVWSHRTGEETGKRQDTEPLLKFPPYHSHSPTLSRRHFSSSGFKAILDNSEIQHRVLKELPLLGAIEGFSKIRGNRRLSAEEVRWNWDRGIGGKVEISSHLPLCCHIHLFVDQG